MPSVSAASVLEDPALSQSDVHLAFERAFRCATGLPLTLAGCVHNCLQKLVVFSLRVRRARAASDTPAPALQAHGELCVQLMSELAGPAARHLA